MRDHRKHPLRLQKALMAERGITKVYDNLTLLVRQRRAEAGDIVAVKRLMLLADPSRLRIKGGMRHALRETLEALEAVGAIVVELDTGRRRDDRAVAEQMLLDAIDELARTRRGMKVGRPKRAWSDDKLTIMRSHWFDHSRYGTNDAAVRAINADGVEVTASQVIKLLGPSRRMHGNPKLRKIVQEERATAPRVVYFIQASGSTGPIKIGVAVDAYKRLSGLQTGTHRPLRLLGTIPGNEVVEREMHEKFRKYRVSGEWFRCEGALAAYVERFRKRKRQPK